MPSLNESIKTIALQALENSMPVAIMFGTVISALPLKINIEQRLTLEEKHLILTNMVKDHDVDMTVDHQTGFTSGGSGESSFASHNHSYSGKKIYTIHNGLKVGESVILLRVQGGQKYVVLDRM